MTDSRPRPMQLEVHESVSPRVDDAVVVTLVGALGPQTFETFRGALTQRRGPQQRVRIMDMSQLTEIAPEEVPRTATLLKLLQDEMPGQLLLVAPPEALAQRLAHDKATWVFARLDAAEAHLAAATHPAPAASEPARSRAARTSVAGSTGQSGHPHHHLDAFLGFCYGLLKNQSFALPPGASADGLAAVFADDEARGRVAEVLSTLALERLLRSLPLLPPELLVDQQRLAASPWDARLDAHLRPGIHPRTIQVFAHLFLVASRAFATVTFDDTKDGGRYMIELGQRLIDEGRACRGHAVECALPAFAHFVEFDDDAEPSEIAALDPFEYTGSAEQLSLIDLVLLDEAVQATHQATIKLHRQVPELATAWRRMLAPLFLLSPLSALMRIVERLTFTAEETPFAEALAAPPAETVFEGLFSHGNVLALAYLEDEIAAVWCLEEERSRHRISLRDAWIDVFTATLERLFDVAERMGHPWVLKIVPRFYAEWFQRHSEQVLTRHVRARMVELTRLSERQSLIRRELSMFEPLNRFEAMLEQMRQLNWAERTPQQAFLLDQPMPMLPRLRQSIRLCQEKLALPFGRIARS